MDSVEVGNAIQVGAIGKNLHREVFKRIHASDLIPGRPGLFQNPKPARFSLVIFIERTSNEGSALSIPC
jgi:hypothetical protein